MQKENQVVLPLWMHSQNEYVPHKDKQSFVTKTILSFFRLFRHFHVKRDENITQLRAGSRTLLVLGLIILSALSKNIFYSFIILAAFLVYLCFSKIDVLKRVLSTSLAAAFFSALIMLPAFFLYKSHAIYTITLKVFLSTGMLSLYSLITPWNKITASLRFIKIPNFLIFILDLTIHYILILGNIAYDMLLALKLRSVGKNKSKERSFSGILGTLFLKSVSLSKETQQSMECRLFNGNYAVRKEKQKFMDIFPIFVLILYIILYIFIA